MKELMAPTQASCGLPLGLGQPGLFSDAIGLGRLNGQPAAPRILLVEDNLIVQRAVALLLQRTGCTVDIANNGKEALALFGQAYHLILLDIGLPDMDGIAVAAAMREREKRLPSRVPIIAHTSHNENEIKQRCIAVGIDEVRAKLITPIEVKQLLGKWIKA